MPTPTTPTGSSNCGADGLAQGIFDVLKADFTFNLPVVDLNGPSFQMPPREGTLFTEPVKLTNEDLTTGVVGGTGTFDVIMKSMYAHIRTEFDQGRITGDQYAKAYIELTTAALSSATQYVLSKDQAHWAAINAQIQARRAEIEVIQTGIQLEIGKADLAIRMIELQNQEANYALAKLRLATEDAQFCQIKAQTLNIQKEYEKSSYELTHLMPLQKSQGEAEVAQITYTTTQMMPAQKASLVAEADTKEYNLTQILPKQRETLITEEAIKQYNLNQLLPLQRLGMIEENSIKDYQVRFMLPSQREGIEAETRIKTFTRDDILPIQKNIAQHENDIKQFTSNNIMPLERDIKRFTADQVKAQTSNSNTNGATITGLIGKQKDLYDQQIDSYVKDGQYKAAKMFLDGWIVQKTADEALTAPGQLQNQTVNEVLNKMQTIHNLR